jgi:glutathione S-transferase
MYAHMLPRKDFMLEFNDVGVPRWEDVMMRRLWPVVARWGARELEVREGTLEQDRPRVLAAFDAIAARFDDGRPYLFGERFTAADLTFAALAAAVVAPPEYGTPLPQLDVLPEPVAHDVAAFRAHPAGAFALRMFREHRRAGAA